MLELGVGEFLKIIERRAGPFWSGLLLFVAYLAVFGVCLNLTWEYLLVPAYHVAAIFTDWILHGNFVLPTINSWWDGASKAVTGFVTLMIGGGATYIAVGCASLLGWLLRLMIDAVASGEFKKEFDRLKAERAQRNVSQDNLNIHPVESNDH